MWASSQVRPDYRLPTTDYQTDSVKNLSIKYKSKEAYAKGACFFFISYSPISERT